MKKYAVRSLLVVLALAMTTAGLAFAQSSSTRTLSGTVYGSNNAPISGAIVYLQDSKTNGIRSFFSTSNGSYRFGPLSSDTDYHVWAKYKNRKSSTRTVSSYDTRTTIVIDLNIKTK
ncbi:MAG TPA: carboxypeptidase-like regulatory domain-containing protein [Acidobacteriaceae bacterium]|nr:carboxypeptidase-like regulatory domain-containing protein [Acidobacteriaceae bacterium]